MRISDWSSDVCSSDLLDAPADPFLQQRFVGYPEPVECSRRVVERRALEPGAVAVDLLEVLGDRARRQPAADLAVARCELRRAVGIEQPGSAGLAAGDIAVRQTPVLAGPGRSQRARPRRPPGTAPGGATGRAHG